MTELGELKFEEALARLVEILHRLEQGEVPLDESLLLFEESVKLARFCNQKLDEAEAKVELMLEDGELEAFEVKEK